MPIVTPNASTWPPDGTVVSAQGGDVDALTAVVATSHPHVLRFARAVCHSEQDAEDATQEALLILYRKVGTLRAPAALAGWMYRIVRNECLRRIAAGRRWRHESIDVADQLPGVQSTEDEVVRRLASERIAVLVAQLPDDQRHVLLLRDAYGFSGTHVAAHLGLSIPAMKSRLHRARAAVRESLLEYRVA